MIAIGWSETYHQESGAGFKGPSLNVRLANEYLCMQYVGKDMLNILPIFAPIFISRLYFSLFCSTVTFSFRPALCLSLAKVVRLVKISTALEASAEANECTVYGECQGGGKLCLARVTCELVKSLSLSSFC